MRFSWSTAVTSGIAAWALGAHLPSSTASADAPTQSACAVLEPLIGEWDVGPQDASAAFIQRFAWGPARGYVWASVALVRAAGDEHLHLEGLIAWNGATGRCDYLFVVEPGSLSQERGEIYVEDRQIVRDVTLTAPDGAMSRFRQTFRALDDGRYATTLMRRDADGWAPTFPGSDRLIMVRRPR